MYKSTEWAPGVKKRQICCPGSMSCFLLALIQLYYIVFGVGILIQL